MARCPNCGSENPGYALYCGKCGHEVPRTGIVDQGETTQKPPEEGRAPEIQGEPARPTYEKKIDMKTCTGCWRAVESSFPFCPYCGKPMESRQVGQSGVERIWDTKYSAASERQSASGILVAGGILAVVAGVLALGQGLLYGGVSSLVPSGFLCLCSGLDVVFGIASILGGIFAVQRKNFVLAILGAILGMLGIGLLIGFVLGLLAVIFIAVSRQEFD